VRIVRGEQYQSPGLKIFIDVPNAIFVTGPGLRPVMSIVPFFPFFFLFLFLFSFYILSILSFFLFLFLLVFSLLSYPSI
jgi:hypothetical protein